MYDTGFKVCIDENELPCTIQTSINIRSLSMKSSCLTFLHCMGYESKPVSYIEEMCHTLKGCKVAYFHGKRHDSYPMQ
jgi:hypothetical protein